MTTVFLSGSRKISRLNKEIRSRLRNIINQGFWIILGDANGADKALQKYLLDINYSNVVIFYSGVSCRNNVGNWTTKKVSVVSNLKGRDFYTKIDKEMAREADYGFVLWDGKSPGSINNVIELLKRNKKTLVYLFSEREFYSISNLDDINELLNKCDKEALDLISKKIKLASAIKELQRLHQEALGFKQSVVADDVIAPPLNQGVRVNEEGKGKIRGSL